MHELGSRVPAVNVETESHALQTRDLNLTRSIGVLLLLCLVGLALTGLEQVLHEQPFWQKVAEHAASAFIVAAVIGLSYELLLHKQREAKFDRLFEEHRRITHEVSRGNLSLEPGQVFDLLADIASQIHDATDMIPTIYQPPRKQHREYAFTKYGAYFDMLVKVRREDMVKVLADWIDRDSKRGVKFLGSDFIGQYELRELAEQLNDEAARELKEWNTLAEADKEWVLNFIWAASRCEDKKYSQLARLIQTTPHVEIREWILFIPQQMRDTEFLDVIRSFLDRDDTPTDNEIALVIHGLGELYTSAEREVNSIFRRHRKVFGTDAAHNQIRTVWGTLRLPAEPVLKLLQH